MPRRKREGSGGIPHHVLNRASRRAALFEHYSDYQMFIRVLLQAKRRVPMRIAAFAVMPNHWHLVLWPKEDGHLAQFMHWLTMTHTQRWHTARGTTGTGPLYQGRYKAIAVQSDAHFLTVARYVERNPVRGGLARRAEDWRWSSAWYRRHAETGLVDEWPVPVPHDWAAILNQEQMQQTLDGVREAVRRSSPYGDRAWRATAAKQFKVEHSLRRPGRPGKK